MPPTTSVRDGNQLESHRDDPMQRVLYHSIVHRRDQISVQPQVQCPVPHGMRQRRDMVCRRRCTMRAVYTGGGVYTGRQAAVYQTRRHEVWGDPEAYIAACDGQSRCVLLLRVSKRCFGSFRSPFTLVYNMNSTHSCDN